MAPESSGTAASPTLRTHDKYYGCITEDTYEESSMFRCDR